MNHNVRSNRNLVLNVLAASFFLGSVVAVIGTMAFARATRTMRTAQTFTDLVRSGDYEAAQSMIVATDRDRIPSAYWRQFDSKAPQLYSAPTIAIFVDGAMSIWLGDGTSRAGIRFTVAKDGIHVADIAD